MAVVACIQRDMAGAHVDVASAISAARSMGVEPADAAALIMAASTGFNEGAAERTEADASAPEPG
jgi:hypothetical protein